MPVQINYFDLGASLYIPSTHKNLSFSLQEGVSGLRSMVVCLEDAVKDDDLSFALKNLKEALKNLTPNSKFKRFIRPRNPLILAEILNYEYIDKIDGFILPKFDLHTHDLYEKVFQEQTQHPFYVMPTLETSQVFDPKAMALLSERLLSWGDRIICLRIGGNDLMNLLGIKRMKGMTTYDTPLRSVIDQLIMHFRPKGFELSAPVFDMIDDIETLKKELAMDLVYGFFAKTAIHPTQVPVIESAFFDFTENHIEQARCVLNEESAAVFKFNGQMMEPNCHKHWANRTLQLAERYS
jgi:citrate lyase beta subunit